MDRRRFLSAGVERGTAVIAGSLLAATAPLAQTPPNRRQETPLPSTRPNAGRKARVFITGSADGLGRAAAATLLAEGHEVVVHVRSKARLPAVEALVDRGAIATIGDLSDLAQIRDLAGQVDAIGRMDAIIHNAGIISGAPLLVVNVVAPYLLTALIQRPQRLLYLSSSMHRGGRADLAGLDWSGRTATGNYSDSKLFVTALTAAVARRWPDVFSNAVDPGWVPTRMGGANAPDDLRLGHLTQEWLATSDDSRALTSGGYWHHQQRQAPHPAVGDTKFQDLLLGELARATGTTLPG
ncbi:MAG: SDR family NAD(P)-dependent oxidoreductase [Burkholderiaceae bacterium]